MTDCEEPIHGMQPMVQSSPPPLLAEWTDYTHEIHVEEAPGLRTLLVGRDVEESAGGAIRFWVGVALVSVGVGVIDAVGARPWLPVSWLVWFVAIAAAGVAVMMRLRSEESVTVRTLALADRDAQEVRLRRSPGSVDLVDGPRISFEDVVEVIYALRDVELPGPGRRTSLLGAAVHVRDTTGTVWPVISATHAREAAFRAASVLALRIGVGVKQVGAGWRTSGS